MFNRIFLFLLTNLAVLMLVGIVMSLLGVNPAQMSGLLVMAAIFGFGGSFISLLLSKFMAKRSIRCAGHHRAAHADRTLVAGDRAPSGPGCRYRHAGSSGLRGPGNQRVRHRRQPQQRPCGGVHRPAAEHGPG
ncbi:hypothetical protein KOJCDNHJ_02611 [Xanthomonas citri pv. punicae]|nr:hypothetical protein FICKIIDM_03601 [Xanthomonas citri pv. punicae]UIS29207.1 hypothetical protein KOJCDNHJ_02611 [Xanthomonas citri pv. punicae]